MRGHGGRWSRVQSDSTGGAGWRSIEASWRRACWSCRGRSSPPAEFREQALLNDPAVYEEAARDPQAWWAGQAKQLHWFEPWETVLDDSNPPFYKWFVGGKLNVSYNCLDRHVLAGRGERVALHWRGEDGEERDITYARAARRGAALRQRAEGPRGAPRATSWGSTCR